MNKNEEMAWIGGFFDGEGCISITKRQRSENFVEHFLAVQIAQKQRHPLEMIQRRFGGCLSVARRGDAEFYYLRMHGTRAQRFIEEVRPYLICKDGEADLALELRRLIGKPGSRSTPEIWRKKDRIWSRFMELREKQRRGVALSR
jgi:hypothetical protein